MCGMWVEVCIRKEDVVLLSRKGRGCLLCVSNMQVLGTLVFCYLMICSRLMTAAMRNGYRPCGVVVAGRWERAVMPAPTRTPGKHISVLTKETAKEKLSGRHFSYS